MSRDDNNFDDDLSIVPDRDDLAPHRGKKRGNSTVTASPTSRTPRHSGNAGQGIGGGIKFLLGVLLLGLFATAGGAYYFYDQGQQTLISMADANDRIRLLENRLSMVDESVEQSSMGLLERVDFNFSEIDKLWAARNTLRAEVSVLDTRLANQAESLTGVETAVTNQAGIINRQAASLEQQSNLLDSVQERLQALRNEMPDGAALNQQLARINNDLEVLKSSVTNEGSDIATRVSSTEQDIESINIYRLQLNQTISAMREDLNALQQRLATMSSSASSF